MRPSLRQALRSVFERLPDSRRERLLERRTALRQLGAVGQLKANQALLARRLADLELRVGASSPTTSDVPDPRFPDGVRSRLCTQEQIEQPWFGRWCAAAAMRPTAHRKTWEFTYIAEVLDRLDLLRPGTSGLGFGVGQDPLVSMFAARGVRVLGTDLGAADRDSLGWSRSDQHAAGVDAMLHPDVCDPERYRELVSWRPVDMRRIPDDLADFDFCWSACALEHLGSLELGIQFITESLRTLRPGGIAVHTTEFNLTSDVDTAETGPTVVYRRRDIEQLTAHLEAAGHEVAALDLRRGDGLLDQYVDVAPYADEPVLRFRLGSYTLTSVAIVVRRAG